MRFRLLDGRPSSVRPGRWSTAARLRLPVSGRCASARTERDRQTVEVVRRRAARTATVPPDHQQVGDPDRLRRGGGLIGELHTVRDRLDDLASRGGSLRQIDEARRRRDRLARALLELGFTPRQLSRFAGTTAERLEQLRRPG